MEGEEWRKMEFHGREEVCSWLCIWWEGCEIVASDEDVLQMMLLDPRSNSRGLSSTLGFIRLLLYVVWIYIPVLPAVVNPSMVL